jgi:hypothetical protein
MRSKEISSGCNEIRPRLWVGGLEGWGDRYRKTSNCGNQRGIRGVVHVDEKTASYSPSAESLKFEHLYFRSLLKLESSFKLHVWDACFNETAQLSAIMQYIQYKDRYLLDSDRPCAGNGRQSRLR